MVEVALACHGAGWTQVKLSYVVPSALWRPEYDLRFLPGASPEEGQVELSMAAIIQQSTGEDWDGAELLLSTARPRLGVEAPLPAQLQLWGQEAEEEQVLVEAWERRETLSAGEQPSSARPKRMELKDQGRAFLFRLPQRVMIRADGREHWMPVELNQSKARLKWIAIPMLSPYLYQVLQFKNPLPYPLIPGALHLFRRGSYVGDGQLSYVAPGEALEISLGVDEEFKLKRRDLLSREEGASFLSSTKKLLRAYQIDLSNNATQPRSVELREAIPVSKSEEIKVLLDQEEITKDYQLDRERGLLSWSLSLKSGEQRSLKLAYQIDLPDDWEVRLR